MPSSHARDHKLGSLGCFASEDCLAHLAARPRCSRVFRRFAGSSPHAVRSSHTHSSKGMSRDEWTTFELWQCENREPDVVGFVRLSEGIINRDQRERKPRSYPVEGSSMFSLPQLPFWCDSRHATSGDVFHQRGAANPQPHTKASRLGRSCKS